MQEFFVDVYRTLRDKPQIITPQDAADYAEILKPQPPSKAHRKRLIRSHEPAPELRGRCEPSPRYEFWKSQMAVLHGTRTVKPNVEPKVPPIRVIAPARSAEFSATPPAYPEPKPMSIASNRPLRKAHLIAIARKLHVDYEFDMFELTDLFGSVEAFDHAVRNT